MRGARDILLILLTAACVASGAFLPQGAAVLQDQRLERGSETRQLDAVQLLIRQELSTTQMLTLLSGPYTRVAWDSGTSLTEQEAKALMFGLLEDMVLNGLLPESADPSFGADNWDPAQWEVDTDTFLMISQGDSQMALLLWECVWEAPGDAVYDVWIDDATGMLCGISRVTRNDSAPVPAAEPRDTLALWTEFLFNACGLRTLEAEVSDWDQGRSTVALTLSSANNTRDICTVTLTIEGADFSFVL